MNQIISEIISALALLCITIIEAWATYRRKKDHAALTRVENRGILHFEESKRSAAMNKAALDLAIETAYAIKRTGTAESRISTALKAAEKAEKEYIISLEESLAKAKQEFVNKEGG